MDTRGGRTQAPGLASPPRSIGIRCLGRFEITGSGQAPARLGRMHTRPIYLLKAMLARGGMDVDADALVAHVWSDLDGDAGRNALDLALHRLRKLLGSKQAILTRAGQLSINARLVWVDIWEFEALCDQLPKLVRAGQSNAVHVAQLLDCYRGAFLSDESCSWALTMRERLRSRFIRVIGLLADALAHQRSSNEVVALCRHAIEMEPTAEEFHARLIRCYCAEGRDAEALAAYERCRELLRGVLGVEPSPVTKALARKLLESSRVRAFRYVKQKLDEGT